MFYLLTYLLCQLYVGSQPVTTIYAFSYVVFSGVLANIDPVFRYFIM